MLRHFCRRGLDFEHGLGLLNLLDLSLGSQLSLNGGTLGSCTHLVKGDLTGRLLGLNEFLVTELVLGRRSPK